MTIQPQFKRLWKPAHNCQNFQGPYQMDLREVKFAIILEAYYGGRNRVKFGTRKGSKLPHRLRFTPQIPQH